MQHLEEDFSGQDEESMAAIDCSKGLPGLLDLPESKHRAFCGDVDIHIDADGTWFSDGSPFTRKDLICLFASVLHRDAKGDYWIATPAELGRISVDDAPFLAVEMFVQGTGRDQEISFRTNIDEMVTVGKKHPLRVRDAKSGSENAPYVGLDRNMEAKLSRAVYYELVSHGIEEEINGETLYGVWSNKQFFPLGSLNQN